MSETIEAGTELATLPRCTRLDSVLSRMTDNLAAFIEAQDADLGIARSNDMIETQRLSKEAPKTIACPGCERKFVNDYALNAHRTAKGH